MPTKVFSSSFAAVRFGIVYLRCLRKICRLTECRDFLCQLVTLFGVGLRGRTTDFFVRHPTTTRVSPRARPSRTSAEGAALRPSLTASLQWRPMQSVGGGGRMGPEGSAIRARLPRASLRPRRPQALGGYTRSAPKSASGAFSASARRASACSSCSRHAPKLERISVCCS